jgi:hypothetical protein
MQTHFFANLYSAGKICSSLDIDQLIIIYRLYRIACLSYTRFLPFFSFFLKFIQSCTHFQFFRLHSCKCCSLITFCKLLHFCLSWKTFWFLKKQLKKMKDSKVQNFDLKIWNQILTQNFDSFFFIDWNKWLWKDNLSYLS